MTQKLINDLNTVSLFNDPFKVKAIKKVSIELHNRQSFFREDKFHQATIYFSVNNTDGQHHIYSNDFQELYNLIQIFISSLDNE